MGEQFRKLMTVQMGFTGDCNPDSESIARGLTWRNKYYFQAGCKAKAKINICQDQLQMRFLLILECHKNSEGLKRTLKGIIKYLWIWFVKLRYLSHIFFYFFSPSSCEWCSSVLKGRRAFSSNLVTVKLSLAGTAVAGSSSGVVTTLPDTAFRVWTTLLWILFLPSSVSIPPNKIKASLTFF